MVRLMILMGFSILPFVTSLTQKSALIKRIPHIPNGSSEDFEIGCAFKILKEDALGARLVDGSTDCQTLSSDENMETSNTEANLKYFRKTTSFKTDGTTELVKHFLTKNVTEFAVFEFFVQQIKEDEFSLTIRFENGKGDAAVVIFFGSDKLSFHIEGNNSSSANQSVYAVWADLREHSLSLKLTNQKCWVISLC